MAVLGAALGYLLGNGLAILQAAEWLSQSSEAVAAHDSAALAEARSVLNSMQRLSSGFCSASEMEHFKSLVFRSEYIKDAGRIRGGRIECAVTSGESLRALGRLRPDLRLADGAVAYRNLPTNEKTDRKRALLQLGSAYVVFPLGLPLHTSGPIPMQLAITTRPNGITLQNLAATAAGEVIATFAAIAGRGGRGSKLRSTYCSESNFDCVTSKTSIPDAIHSQSDLLASSALAGGLAGILCGMGFSLVYCRRRELTCQLRRAIKRNDLKVVYQPIVNLETREIVGAEALARWTDEDNNNVDPELFVKAAEDFGFVGSITRQVLQSILRDFAPTIQKRPGFHISLNVAASDLADPNFLPMLESALREFNVRPQNLVVEITERSAANSEIAKETIRNLRRLGHSIHIDDFGAGYSNLDRLLYLYADTIKIDKAFTKMIGTESVAGLILPQIMNMAQSLNLEVIVEGIETTQQADYFSSATRKIYGQGWLFGRPMTAEALCAELIDNPLIRHPMPAAYSVLGIRAVGV
jgi:sensor c-di-GMP phosphodiesterase-like protein